MLFLCEATEKERTLHDIKLKLTKAEEVSFSDIIKFFILNGKLIGIITAFLSPLVIWLCLQSPRVYQKQLTVAVKLKFFLESNPRHLHALVKPA